MTEEDVGKAIPFLSVAQQFATGKIDESDFHVKLECVGFAFLQKLAAANTSWTCPKCGEESPLTFAVCWKCGEMRDGVHEPSDDDPPKTPYLDQFLKNEGGPFGPLEQLKMTESTRPFKVDLVTQSDAGVYGLVLNEFGPWEPPVVEENLEKLAQRVSDCVTAIVNGQLASKFPSSSGCSFVIRFSSFETPRSKVDALLTSLKTQFAMSPDIQAQLGTGHHAVSIDIVHDWVDWATVQATQEAQKRPTL